MVTAFDFEWVVRLFASSGLERVLMVDRRQNEKGVVRARDIIMKKKKTDSNEQVIVKVIIGWSNTGRDQHRKECRKWARSRHSGRGSGQCPKDRKSLEKSEKRVSSKTGYEKNITNITAR